MKSIVLLSLLLLLAGSSHASEAYRADYEPHPPIPFPAAFRDYQILPRSISPDQKYAFIYPKRSLLYEIPHIRLLLVTLQPFHVVSELPIHGRSSQRTRMATIRSTGLPTLLRLFSSSERNGDQTKFGLLSPATKGSGS